MVYLLIILLLGGVYLWFFTEMGNQAADLASSNLSMLIETISGTGQKGEEVGPAQVDLMDISQRFNQSVVTSIAVVNTATQTSPSDGSSANPTPQKIEFTLTFSRVK